MSSDVKYIPLNSINPNFATVVEAENVYEVPPDVMGVIKASQRLSIRQHVKVLPKQCFSCPPCVKQENTYSIYAGLNMDNYDEFMRVDEVSDDWNRCCCTPYHPVKLEVRQFIPSPDANLQNTSDWDHLKNDAAKDFGRFTKQRKADYMTESYKRQPVLFTMVRDDGMRCCYKCPCKCLNTFVCFSCCQDGLHIYAGDIPNDPKELGRFEQLPTEKLIGSAIQPNFGGCCTPTLHLFGPQTEEKPEPFGKIEGPCIFGGWSEMFCNFNFFVSNFKSPGKSGDLGLIVKEKPKSAANALQELISDADNYSIHFSGLDLTPEQKVTILGGQLLADYMFFDGNTEKCKQEGDTTTCYLCYCSIIGAIIPCQCSISSNSN